MRVYRSLPEAVASWHDAMDLPHYMAGDPAMENKLQHMARTPM